MILFVFEGKDDKTYFESFKRLFFPEKLDTFVCTYNSNIYSLYTKLMEHDVLNGALEVDTVSVLKEILLASLLYFQETVWVSHPQPPSFPKASPTPNLVSYRTP